jgi:hypothetical protein
MPTTQIRRRFIVSRETMNRNYGTLFAHHFGEDGDDRILLINLGTDLLLALGESAVVMKLSDLG